MTTLLELETYCILAPADLADGGRLGRDRLLFHSLLLGAANAEQSHDGEPSFDESRAGSSAVMRSVLADHAGKAAFD